MSTYGWYLCGLYVYGFITIVIFSVKDDAVRRCQLHAKAALRLGLIWPVALFCIVAGYGMGLIEERLTRLHKYFLDEDRKKDQKKFEKL
jgi:hypothetical protein